uniref:RNase H domain-containing protein n=1 Tax=Rhodnius prolixus TaxID=13249 RepID=T1IE47_RHOPR
MQEGPRTTGAAQQSWMPGHVGIEGNAKADHLARNGANTPFIGPEPVLGITRGSVRAALRDWIWREHEKNWVMCPGVKHSKTMMPFGCVSKEPKRPCV